MQLGDVIADRFVVERPIRSGGMGAVFSAWDRVAGESVAIKVLEASKPGLSERFFREAWLLSELRHRGIVRYIAHGDTREGKPFLVMEWLRGEDLCDRLARGPLSISETLAMCRRVCEGLAVAHERGIVHRDVKPSNLFLVGGNPNNVKLLDFGIARVRETMHVMTQTGSMLGTPGYMAPEQARTDEAISATADIFSLGCVLYECLTGEPPFTGSHFMAVLAKVLLQPAPRVRTLRPEIPALLDDLVARMLEKDPANRPPTAAAVASELERIDISVTVAEPADVIAPSFTTREQVLLCVLLIASEWKQGLNSTETMGAGDGSLTLEELAARHGGKLEFLGDDAMVVVFEPRSAATDLASRAAQCALAFRVLLPDSTMALATGQGLVAGRLPLGAVIDRAAGLLGSATAKTTQASVGASKTARVWLDRATAGLIDAQFEIATEGSGVCLLGVRELRETGRLLLGKRTPCVGRERELANLNAIFDESATEPSSRAVLIIAPPGAGKSRLRREFTSSIIGRSKDVRVWYAFGDPTRAGSPFGLLSQALRTALGVVDGEPLDLRRRAILDRIGTRLPREEAQRVAEFLGEVVGVRFPDDQSIQLRAARRDARIMGDQIARAWEDWLELECAEAPVVLVLEDLHLGDLSTVKLVDSALRNLRSRPFLVLGLSRPEIADLFPGLWKGRPLEEISLRPLPKRACEDLVRSVLGDVGAEAIARVVERAEGNAFYLEELIRAEAEGTGDDFPETMLAMVQARFGRLAPEARHLLRAASIFGQFFWSGGLHALCDASVTDGSVPDLIQGLVTREWVRLRRSSRLAGEPEYEFHHALLREAAYGTLTDQDRSAGHRLAALWLEGAGERDAATLAEHFQRGGDRARAAESYLRAAEQALEGDDLSTAIAHAERGVACGADGPMLGRLRLIQAEAHNWRGEHEAAGPLGAEAITLLDKTDDSAVGYWADAVNHTNWAEAALGRYEKVESFADMLLATATNRGEQADARLVAALAHVATWQLILGGASKAQSTLAWLKENAAAIAAQDPLVAAVVKSAFARQEYFNQNFAESLQLYDATAEDLRRIGHRRLLVFTLYNTALFRAQVGDYRRAETTARESVALAERLSVAFPLCNAILAFAIAHLGDLRAAERLLNRCIEECRVQGARRAEAEARVWCCRVAMMRGNAEIAEEQGRTAVRLTKDEPPIEAYALAALASALLAQKRASHALEPARMAFETAESIGNNMEDGDAFVRLTYAEVLDALDDRATARETIRTARDRLIACANRINDDELRRNFLENVTENARTLELARRWLDE